MEEIIIQALVTSLGVAPIMLGHYLKFKADTNVSRRKSDNSHKHLKHKIDNLDLKIVELDKIVKKNINKHEFKEELGNRISRKGLNLISAYSDLTPEIVSVLNLTHIKIKNFAVNYYKSQYRLDKGLVSNYIEIETNTIRDAINHAANDAFQGRKNGELFDQFIQHQTYISKVINAFIDRLSINRLTDEKYVRLFENLVSDILKNQIAGWRLWNNY